MNIVFIRRNWSATGGAENYLVRLVQALKQRHDYHVTLLCESWDRDPDPFSRIVTFPVNGPSFRKPWLFADACNAYLHSNKQDLVFSMERGIKADVYRAGDGVHRMWLEKRQHARPLRGFFQNVFNAKNHVLLDLERITFHPDNTRVVIANSEMVRDDIQKCFNFPTSQIRVIPNGVDVELFSSGSREQGRKALGLDNNCFIALLVGSGAERKGHANARKVMEAIPEQGQLVIIDSPPPCPMPDVYAAADIFLFPTVYDPFANVTLEAMAAGLPVITTHSNGASQVIRNGKNGYLVKDPAEIGEMCAYVKALRDPALRLEMGRQARESAHEFSLARNVESTLQLFGELAPG